MKYPLTRDLPASAHTQKRTSAHTQKRPDYFRNRGVFIKEGGFLLSRIALQYHRRKWA